MEVSQSEWLFLLLLGGHMVSWSPVPICTVEGATEPQVPVRLEGGVNTVQILRNQMR